MTCNGSLLMTHLLKEQPVALGDNQLFVFASKGKVDVLPMSFGRIEDLLLDGCLHVDKIIAIHRMCGVPCFQAALTELFGDLCCKARSCQLVHLIVSSIIILDWTGRKGLVKQSGSGNEQWLFIVHLPRGVPRLDRNFDSLVCFKQACQIIVVVQKILPPRMSKLNLVSICYEEKTSEALCLCMCLLIVQQLPGCYASGSQIDHSSAT